MSRPSSQHQSNVSLLTTQEKLSTRQAQRTAKAAERRKNSESLKEEGNKYFRQGDYQRAADKYQEAIRVHGASVKPILLTNLATAYYNLGKFCEANEAAEKALEGDPKSVKARYRRAMARKNMDMWRAAAIDFRVVLQLDPRYQEVKKELAYVEQCRRENRLLDDEDTAPDSEYELPAPGDEPELGESLSESSDCEHKGNGKPCKFYNRTECKKGHACPFSHAPDHESERDALGRNVCRNYLMGACKLGEKCNYAHSKELLSQKGWWSAPESIDKTKRIDQVLQKFKQAAIDYEENESSAIPKTVPAPKKKRSKGKKKGGTGSDRVITAQSGRTVTSCAAPGEDDLDYDEEYGMFGFTNSEVEELLCHGIKPWGDIREAREFLGALHGGYREIDGL